MREGNLVAAILLEFGSRPGVRLWRQNAGAARTRTGAFVRFGVPGQADISGIMAPTGQRIEIECKTENGRVSAAQRKWGAMIEKFGGIYVVARSVEDVRELLG